MVQNWSGEPMRIPSTILSVQERNVGNKLPKGIRTSEVSLLPNPLRQLKNSDYFKKLLLQKQEQLLEHRQEKQRERDERQILFRQQLDNVQRGLVARNTEKLRGSTATSENAITGAAARSVAAFALNSLKLLQRNRNDGIALSGPSGSGQIHPRVGSHSCGTYSGDRNSELANFSHPRASELDAGIDDARLEALKRMGQRIAYAATLNSINSYVDPLSLRQQYDVDNHREDDIGERPIREFSRSPKAGWRANHRKPIRKECGNTCEAHSNEEGSLLRRWVEREVRWCLNDDSCEGDNETTSASESPEDKCGGIIKHDRRSTRRSREYDTYSSLPEGDSYFDSRSVQSSNSDLRCNTPVDSAVKSSYAAVADYRSATKFSIVNVAVSTERRLRKNGNFEKATQYPAYRTNSPKFLCSTNDEISNESQGRQSLMIEKPVVMRHNEHSQGRSVPDGHRNHHNQPLVKLKRADRSVAPYSYKFVTDRGVQTSTIYAEPPSESIARPSAAHPPSLRREVPKIQLECSPEDSPDESTAVEGVATARSGTFEPSLAGIVQKPPCHLNHSSHENLRRNLPTLLRSAASEQHETSTNGVPEIQKSRPKTIMEQQDSPSDCRTGINLTGERNAPDHNDHDIGTIKLVRSAMDYNVPSAHLTSITAQYPQNSVEEPQAPVSDHQQCTQWNNHPRRSINLPLRSPCTTEFRTKLHRLLESPSRQEALRFESSLLLERVEKTASQHALQTPSSTRSTAIIRRLSKCETKSPFIHDSHSDNKGGTSLTEITTSPSTPASVSVPVTPGANDDDGCVGKVVSSGGSHSIFGSVESCAPVGLSSPNIVTAPTTQIDWRTWTERCKQRPIGRTDKIGRSWDAECGTVDRIHRRLTSDADIMHRSLVSATGEIKTRSRGRSTRHRNDFKVDRMYEFSSRHYRNDEAEVNNGCNTSTPESFERSCFSTSDYQREMAAYSFSRVSSRRRKHISNKSKGSIRRNCDDFDGMSRNKHNLTKECYASTS